MHMIETSLQQRSQLPLPAAHVVIDMRGISDDRALEWLQVEITDLANEMKSREVYHWRHLIDFLSFMRINPNTSHPAGPKQESSTNGNSSMTGLVGLVHSTNPDDMLFSEDVRDPGNAESMPFNLFEQNMNELILEIDRVRTNRIAAVKDLNPAAIPGRSTRDSTVRVVFLTDVDHPESLTSAALYADHLKHYACKFDRPGHQPLLSTTVVCLGNTGEAGPPTALIQGLSLNNSWDHIDSLILSENYREDAALISGTAQAYIAELMLYTLLIVPPFPVSETSSNGYAGPASQPVESPDAKQQLGLPPNTYVVGLAALEYSARWGRRWLNFGLARDGMNALRERPANPGREKITLADIATNWFMGWRQRVQNTIPTLVPAEPEDVPALEGIRRAKLVSEKRSYPFTTRQFNFQIGKSTIKDLQGCLAELTGTYISSSHEIAMQDSLLHGGAQIAQVLREKKQQSVQEREANELTALQLEAERVLSHPKFFHEATGAIPRALMQLEALSHTIDHFRREHQQKPLSPQSTKDNLENRKRRLQERGNSMINSLKEHLAHWPFLAGSPVPRQIMAIITLLLAAFLTAVAVFSGAAWLHHLLLVRFDGLLPYVDYVLSGVPVLTFIAIFILLLLLLMEFYTLRPALMNNRRPGLYTEVTFLLLLIVVALAGWFVSFSITSLGSLPGDILSLNYLLWLSFMPAIGFAAALILLVVLCIEVIYFFWWLDYLLRERRRIVEEMRKQHRRDIEEVIEVIADEVALEIAQRAELFDIKGGPGPYHTRLSRLNDLLDKLAINTQAQQQLAADRLLYKQDEAQQGAGGKPGNVWLNLHIRDERLETEPLTNAYKALREQLIKEHPALKELAEFILRLEGSETPENVERELLEKRDVLASNQRRLQLFLASLVAITLRFVIDPLALRNIDLIDEEYRSIDASTGEEIPALTSFVKTLNKRMSHVTLETSSNKGSAYRSADTATNNKSLAATATALWSQFFWLHSDDQLDEILMTDGILKHLERQLGDDYDPRAVMRRLLVHNVLFGRSLHAGQRVDFRLLMAPSEQSYHFRQGLKSLKPVEITDFPDVERILLLSVKRFVAEPLQLPAPDQAGQLALPPSKVNGAKSNGLSQPGASTATTTHLS
ncbi:MAG TPA: hypothetical protein VFA09_06090 [Ktedonobacteraceae bacterium]|nr:hypothetical protein [Ktedonobacteraceae bacterium]